MMPTFRDTDTSGLQLVKSLNDQIDSQIEVKRNHRTEF